MLKVTDKIQNTTGYWGPMDTTTNFCEPHYSISPYVAEFFNALSSLVYVVAGQYLVRKFYKDRVVLVLALWLVAIGIGSILFHATMRYSMQLADELPMLGFTVTCVWARSTTKHHAGVMKWSYYIRIGICIQALALVVIYVHFKLYEIFLHGYTLMLLVDGILGLVVISVDPHKHMKQRAALLAGGLVIIAKGFWEVENVYCSTNPNIWPMHTIWHFLSAASAYNSTIFARLSRLDANEVLPSLVWWPAEAKTTKKKI